uniref:Putative secreted peptide n=1 Tax=Anopheles braziliensis TaxID=58242 RepID=A0A2M3ZST8_9DIPT
MLRISLFALLVQFVSVVALFWFRFYFFFCRTLACYMLHASIRSLTHTHIHTFQMLNLVLEIKKKEH